MGDAAAAAFNKMPGGEASDSAIIGAHVGRVGGGELAVNQNVWHAARLDAFENLHGSGRLGGGDDETIYLARQQAVHFAGFESAVLLGIADHHVVTQGANGARNAFGDFGEEGVHQVRDNEPDDEGAASGEAARHPVGLIIEFLN